jgi:AAA+ ATPase superfamily predicted ATPase
MEKHLRNPFHYGSIVRGEDFCNRRKEISALQNYIMDGYSVWLYSPRRYGKSSLIHKVFKDTEQVKTIYLDLYNVKSLDDFCKKYAAAIAKNLFSWGDELKLLLPKFSGYFKNLHPSVAFDETGSPSFRLEKSEIRSQLDVETILSIPHQISKKSKFPICIAFDEFQEIKRIEPFLINWMRSAFQHHDNISYIFLGSEQSLMEMIFTSDQSPFYEFAAKMNIEPIAKEEWFTFINQKFEDKGLSIFPENIKTILQKSEGHPHFTQYFAYVVFDAIRSGMDQSAADFTELWMNRVIQSQSIIFQDIYDQLTNIQRSVISGIALLREDQELFSSATRDRLGLPVSSSMVTALESLTKKGLITKRENQYRILNPILREWLLTLS